MHALITNFMNNFYGYGNLEGQYWFIGMEEGCGPDWDSDVKPRFEAWQAGGMKQTEDLRDYHAAIGIRKHWESVDGKPIKVQFTWRRLVETILTAKGEPVTEDRIVAYQSAHLGTRRGENCLLELLPLPSPNIKKFGYTHLADAAHPFFASRPQYRKHIMTTRLDRIRALVAEKKPCHVVLYGQTYERQWNALVGDVTWTPMSDFVKRCQLGQSRIWLVPHPAARLLPRDLFSSLGQMMRATDAY